MEIPGALTALALFAVPFWCGVVCLAAGAQLRAVECDAITVAGLVLHGVAAGIVNNYFPFNLLIGYYVWYASVVLLLAAALLALPRRWSPAPLAPLRPSPPAPSGPGARDDRITS